MSADDPGPLEPLPIEALRPFPPAPLFETIVARGLADLSGADSILVSAADSVAAVSPAAADAALSGPLNELARAIDDSGTIESDPGFARDIGVGDELEHLRDSMRAPLPPPETPIDFDPGGPWDQAPVPDPDVAPDPVGGQPPTEPGEPAPPNRDPAYWREVVRQLYLTLLEREPDPAGWDNWVHEIIHNGHTARWVEDRIRESDEYRGKHGG